ncbi:HNH endonuclease [Klebsiella quasipneumoniae]|uniref:HNH endonuclease n=2 Tax=Enterobacteriaceae TaxID=543 RepID=UPI000694C701|nr:HNH endonuclease signature motif containing protein [Klebsiella quasipneumoniae]
MGKKKKVLISAYEKSRKAERRAQSGAIMKALDLKLSKGAMDQIKDFISQQLSLGYTPEKVSASVLKQLDAIVKKVREREEKLSRAQAARVLKKNRETAANKAYSMLSITHKEHRGAEIWGMVYNLAFKDVPASEIVSRLKDHPVVKESYEHAQRVREEQIRRAAERQEEQLRVRVDMREVLKYLAEKNGTTYVPPADPAPRHQVDKADDIRNVSAPLTVRPLGGKESESKTNPRTYDLPNLPINPGKLKIENQAAVRQVTKARYADFIKHLIHNKLNGRDALTLAKVFMKQFEPAAVAPAPANDPVVPPADRAPVTEPQEQKAPQHIIDPVIVDGVEYRSTWEAMKTLGIGADADARRFRRDVKAKGEDLWEHNGELYHFELKNKLPEQIAAIQQEERELVDIEFNASGRVAEVFQRDPRAQAKFREMVLKNFDGRCAVTGKRLNGVLEAAHIEGAAVRGCYNASNGVLLSPTFHRLFDRHMMGIDPVTLKVSFAPGIEWEEYEGTEIKPLFYKLNREFLAERWAIFQQRNAADKTA